MSFYEFTLQRQIVDFKESSFGLCDASPGTYFAVCFDEHESEKFQRCKKCESCLAIKRWVFYKKVFARFLANCSSVFNVVLWTFGTSLVKKPYFYEKRVRVHHKTGKNVIWTKRIDDHNMYMFKSMWHTFTDRMRARKAKGLIWNPLMYSIEVGKSNRIHAHLIVSGRLDFQIAIDAWRKVTQEKSNVNYSAKSYDPKFAFKYLAKYLYKPEGGTKDWYYMGDMTKKFEYIPDWYDTCGLDNCDHGISSYNTRSLQQLYDSV